jgi:serine/threonine protein kinase
MEPMEGHRPSRRSEATQYTAPPVAPRGACLEIEELVAMVDGGLPQERADEVLAHIDTCVACADVIATLGSFEREPRQLGRYRIDRLLGAGGMGIVYSGWDPELQRPVAIKLVHPEHSNERSRARMLGEARALARVNHPNVVSVFDVGEHDGEVFLATELIDGETLTTWHAGRSPNEIVAAWLAVARGLAAAHAEGVVHRDVKPANVLVGRDGRVRVGDFGIAYQLGGPSSVSSGRVATKSSEALTDRDRPLAGGIGDARAAGGGAAPSPAPRARRRRHRRPQLQRTPLAPRRRGRRRSRPRSSTRRPR